jgi:tetratricopeptide (TPR) repeat protein
MSTQSANSSGWKSRIREELSAFLEIAGVSKDDTFATLFSPYDEILLHGQYACTNDQVDKALRSFKECVRLRPDAFVPQCALGRILMGQGFYTKAEKYIRRAAELNPDDFKTRVTWLYLLNRTDKDRAQAEKLQQEINDHVRRLHRQLGVIGVVDSSVLRLSHPENFWKHAWCEEARHQFRKNKYTILRNVLPAGFLELLLLSQRAALRSGRMYTQAEWRRHAITDLPLAAVANYQLADLVAKISGSPVIPTYTFAIHYLPGGNMDAHKDRLQNELSMSLNLAVTPPGNFPALRAGLDADSLTEIHLEPNSALFYRGAEVVHARCPVPAGHRVDQTILGFRTVNSKHCYCI